MGISKARASQIITVFPYNIKAPDKILAVPGPISSRKKVYLFHFLDHQMDHYEV